MAVDEVRWRLSVDRDACISSGICVALAGRRFKLTGDGTRPLEEEIAPDDDVVEAAETCPMDAIRVVNAADNTPVAP